jgi:hypothetical protein
MKRFKSLLLDVLARMAAVAVSEAKLLSLFESLAKDVWRWIQYLVMPDEARFRAVRFWMKSRQIRFAPVWPKWP